MPDSHDSRNDPRDDLAVARWRLMLGQFAEPSLGEKGRGPDAYRRMDKALDYLYGREYSRRGVRGRGGSGERPGQRGERGAGLGDSVLAIPQWLREVRDLFPRETVEVIERHALDRYGMTELVTDDQVLKKLEPSYELLKAVLTFRNLMHGPVLETARKIVRKVVEELREKLIREIRPILWGRLNRQRPSRLKVFRNLDWKRTIRANLKHFDREKNRLVLESLHFSSRVERHMPWHIVMAVDCSGSMMDSVIYSAVMAGIFKSLPSLRVSLIAFETAVIDLSEKSLDPTELLMSVQLGGGTDIAGAIGYCETLVQIPTKTIVVVVTDFCEGGPPAQLPAAVKRLREAGVRVLGLAALDQAAQPVYDREMAERCVAAGAEVAALTPQRLAEWLAKVLA